MFDARLLPVRNRLTERMLRVMIRDVRSEKPPDLEPWSPSGQQSPGRKNETRIEPPGSVPERVRRSHELEARDRAARADHPGQLAQCRRRIRDVSKEIRETEGVEGRVLERQRVGVAEHQGDLLVTVRIGNDTAT